MSMDHSWMYRRLDEKKHLRDEYRDGVIQFLNYAYSHGNFVYDNTIRCPCSRCKNKCHKLRDDVQLDLTMFGFVRGYDKWIHHGQSPMNESLNDMPSRVSSVERSGMQSMVMDAAGPEFNWKKRSLEQPPNRDAQIFFNLLEAADEPLYDGCRTHTKLSAISQLFNLKSEFNMPEACYDRMTAMIKRMLPEGDRLPQNLYRTKKELVNLGLSYEKIDACVNNCILYYKENNHLQDCNVCHHPRHKPSEPGNRKVLYKVLHYLPLTPRLQRLYMSSHTAEHMTWHTNRCEDGTMAHPAHGEAWKHFNQAHPSFAFETRNVRIGLCTDGFAPFGKFGTPYSCWPVIISVYNLPPWMCLQREYLFLNMVIPGPKGPGKHLDVFLRPLIDELKMLWNDGVETYDVSRKENFQMRAALLWTISDFPAYAMLSGWSTHGKLACPYCMDKTKSFFLKHGGKPSWFDCHRQFLPPKHRLRSDTKQFRKGIKERGIPPPRLSGEEVRRKVEELPNIVFGTQSGNQDLVGFKDSHSWVKKSIFWELPYWHTNLIRHNLDVMHIEKNIFDNIFNTVMDVKGKTKDNAKARQDLEMYCDRPHLNLIYGENGKPWKPKAPYTLSKEQIRSVCAWARQLKFPDGYASNIARCVNENECKFNGMKSHDCHVFMQRLLPVAFRDLLPKPVWETITELSHFFRDICSTVLHVQDMERLEHNIAETLCNMEKIFPPGFFDSMEHLAIHLAYEAKVGGPVHYRWMYPFERFLHHLKKKVGNRAKVEASIVKSYLNEEVSTFCSLYFDKGIQTRANRVPRNDDGGQVDPKGRLSIFSYPGRPLGPRDDRRFLSDDELRDTHRYVLLNCEELNPFVEKFDTLVKVRNPTISADELIKLRDTQFSAWLQEYVNDTSNETDIRIRSLAYPPHRKVKYYKGYFVNGYKFHTVEHGEGKATMNSGVCVLGSSTSGDAIDYYGMLEDVIELSFGGDKVVLFKCHWYDTSSHRGVRVHPRFKLVEINKKSRLKSNDHFILAQQAHQVYYMDYPKRDRGDWVAVCKTKVRSRTMVPLLDDNDDVEPRVEGPFQEMRSSPPESISLDVDLDDANIPLDNDGDLEEVDPTELQQNTEQDENADDTDDEETFLDLLSDDEHVDIEEGREHEYSSSDDAMDRDD